MAINPMKIVVVRGDRSAAPFFTCVATSFPVGVTITWSKEFGTMKADQVPVGYVFIYIIKYKFYMYLLLYM